MARLWDSGEFTSATGTADRRGLERALVAAAAAGGTSTAESLLGVLIARYPQASPAAAASALQAAVDGHRWATAAYFAGYLADTSPPAAGGGELTARALDDLEDEVTRCLRDHGEEARREARPFRYSDALEAECLERGAEFALTEAIVRCERRRAADMPACKAAEYGDPPVAGEWDGRRPRGVRFAHIEPRVPEGAFGSASDPSPYFSLGAPARSLRVLQDPHEVVLPDREIRVIFNAPPEPLGRTPRIVTLHPPGGRGRFTRAALGRAIAAQYRRLVDEGGPPWSHDLADLDLVEVMPGGEPGLYGLRVVA